MSLADNFIGKECLHKKHGKVIVLHKKQNSRTVVVVESIDKGVGFNEEKNRYDGVKLPNGWMRGQNYDFGNTWESHINNLEYV